MDAEEGSFKLPDEKFCKAVWGVSNAFWPFKRFVYCCSLLQWSSMKCASYFLTAAEL